MGARVRPRAYADIHVVSPRRVISDVRPPRPVPKINDLSIEKLDETAVLRAKTIVGQHITPVPVKIQTTQKEAVLLSSQDTHTGLRPLSLRATPDVVAPAKSISEMLQSIQGPTTEQNATDVDIAETFVENDTRSIQSVMRRMFESKRSMMMTAMSLLLMIGGTVALVSSFTTNKTVGKQVQALTEVASASVDNESLASDEGIPSEDPVPESVVNAYAPPADQPRYITVPRLKNRKTRVLKMGLDNTNSIKTPRTTWDTGWYEGSSKPGDSVGAALIVGHVSGLTTGGVFYNLYRVENGDEILVEMGDGTVYTYRVVGKEEVPLDGIDMNNYLVSKDIDKPGLTLMTCAGEYNPVTETYDNRLAIFAVRDK